MALTKVTSGAVSGLATSATTDTTDASNITTGTIPTARLASALDLSGKTVTLPAASVTAHATNPTKSSIEALGIDLPAANLTGTIADARFPSTLPAVSGANLTGIETVTKSSSNPLITTNGTLGDQWINTTTGELFILKDATTDANVWANSGRGAYNVGGLAPLFKDNVTNFTAPSGPMNFSYLFDGSPCQGGNSYEWGNVGTSESNNWVIMEMVAPVTVTHWKTYSHNNASGYNYTGNISLYGSNNGTSWTSIATNWHGCTSGCCDSAVSSISGTWSWYKVTCYGNTRGTYQNLGDIDITIAT